MPFINTDNSSDNFIPASYTVSTSPAHWAKNPLPPELGEDHEKFVRKRTIETGRNKHENNQVVAAMSRYANTAGYEITRIEHPPIENLNDDFLCGLCHSK